MNKTEPEKTLQVNPELDADLALMAEEVPPMPADFHEKWMNAVRADARKNVPVAENKEGKAPVSLARWTRILSAAAVFVFLIGGTILFRNSKKNLTGAAYRTENTVAAVVGTDAEEAAVLPDGENGEVPDMMNAEEPAMLAAEAADRDAGPAEPLLEMKAAEESSVKTAESSGKTVAAASKAKKETPPMAAGAVMGDAMEEAAVMEDYAVAAEYAAADTYAAEYDMAEEEAEEYEADGTSVTAVPTAEPTAQPTESVPENKPEAESEKVEEKAGFLEQAGSFFTDMGDFLLAALPYLAVLAVPAAVALIIRRKKK